MLIPKWRHLSIQWTHIMFWSQSMFLCSQTLLAPYMKLPMGTYWKWKNTDQILFPLFISMPENPYGQNRKHWEPKLNRGKFDFSFHLFIFISFILFSKKFILVIRIAFRIKRWSDRTTIIFLVCLFLDRYFSQISSIKVYCHRLSSEEIIHVPFCSIPSSSSSMAFH